MEKLKMCNFQKCWIIRMTLCCVVVRRSHTQAHTHRRTHTHTYFWLFCYDQSAVLNGNVLFWKLCTYVCVSCVFCVYRRCIQYPIIFFKCQYSLYIPFNFKLKSQNRKVFHCLFWQVYYLFKFKHFWKIPFICENRKWKGKNQKNQKFL